MQSSGSCESVLQNAMDRLRASGGGAIETRDGRRALTGRQTEEVAEKFASVFYSMVFRGLQRTVPRDAGGAFSEGTRGLVSRYLPREMATTSSDPLTQYIRRQLDQTEGGGTLDERV